ncbi:hypothetical protein BV330_00925 [Pseudomonas syringae pv. actinidiae]|jgi:hypothetical protein|nr:hypothetical protein BV339_01031 [Pseudomonas syringae pv. actinidiae]OSN53417.1 hypothetical protein BV345_00964 [Pseudomonas syringae pv. actinidiae]OSN56847.1 hypothetical protein BV346_00900 [Pseudomonas syringae pv. actinidiae]OSR89160.1 hypothetical protein BV329_00870 [Pseudomonas syringae pv. actinidiae]OSR94406.1 hypothetical protein BV330_00925 [Pseudomonas syringae pv. actinidiae]
MPNSFEAPYTIAKRAPHMDELVMAPGSAIEPAWMSG